jgi:hypothetical protein
LAASNMLMEALWKGVVDVGAPPPTMPRRAFVAERRLDHERWMGEDGTVVVVESGDGPLLPRVVEYDVCVTGLGPCEFLGSRRREWGAEVRRALFGVDEGTYEELIRGAHLGAEARALARRWFSYAGDAGDPMHETLHDRMEAEEALVRVGGDCAHMAVKIAMWNRSIREAMVRARSVWVDSASCVDADCMDVAALRALVDKGRVVRRGDRVAFSWAVEQCDAASERVCVPRALEDDADTYPCDALDSCGGGDCSASVWGFVQRRAVCCTMLRGAHWISAARAYVPPAFPVVEVARNAARAWLDTYAGARDLVVCAFHPWTVRVEGDRLVDVRASVVRPDMLVIDGTRTVRASWCIKHVRTVCVREGWVDVVRKLRPPVLAERVFYVPEPGWPDSALRECARYGSVTILKT